MDSTRPIRALMRGLEALTVLNFRDGATVSEVAQEIHLPRTTVYRILETLCESGFVFRDPADERYRLTLRVRALSVGFDDESWVTQFAKPCLFELGESVAWPVYLATLADASLIVREVTDQHSPLAIEPFTAGMQLALLTTSAGRAYLAHCPDEERAVLLAGLSLSKKDDDLLARDTAQLPRLLAEIARLGYATTTRSHRPVEELSISVPVSLQTKVLAVLTVRFAASAVSLKTGLQRFLPKLRHCAAKISTTFTQAKAEPPANARNDMPRTAA
jgi:IclR family transcriptional regulator, mhp operon transcriptional activator